MKQLSDLECINFKILTLEFCWNCKTIKTVYYKRYNTLYYKELLSILIAWIVEYIDSMNLKILK